MIGQKRLREKSLSQLAVMASGDVDCQTNGRCARRHGGRRDLECGEFGEKNGIGFIRLGIHVSHSRLMVED